MPDLFSAFATDEHDPGGKVKTALPAGMVGAARFHGARQEYRLWLFRKWNGKPVEVPDEGFPVPDVSPILWIGMNPSTADASGNDPTITRIVEFTKLFGAQACFICNVMDYRATFPLDLRKPGVKPCSDKNLSTILHIASECRSVIVCHGVIGDSLAHYPQMVVSALRKEGIKPMCLGKTLLGHPRHPLYLKRDTALEQF